MRMIIGKRLDTWEEKYQKIYDRINDIVRGEAVIIKLTAKDSVTPRKVAASIRTHLRRRNAEKIFIVINKKSTIHVQFREENEVIEEVKCEHAGQTGRSCGECGQII